MSLIELNSTNQDPAEFTNRLASNLRLAPNTSLRLLGYGINVKETEKRAVGIASGGDTMTIVFGNPNDPLAPDKFQLRNVVLKIPDGSYPITGTELCKRMTAAANKQLANGKLPAFCGDSPVVGTNETDGCAFTMNAGKVKFTQTIQRQPEIREGLWTGYNSTENQTKQLQASTITNGGGSSVIETPVQTSNYAAFKDKNYVYFPVIPRQVGGIPDRTQINLAVNSETRTQWSMGGGTLASDSPQKYCCAGGWVYQPATREFQLDGTPSVRDDWANGKDNFWVNHGWEIYETAGGRMNVRFWRGTPNQYGGAGKKEMFDLGATLPDWAANAAWDLTVAMRIVPNNTPASNVASGYVSQIWVAQNNPAPTPATLVDEYDCSDETGGNPLMLSDRINEVYKVLSRGTGVIGDIQGVKITSGTGTGNGNGSGILPAYDYSVQTDMYVFGNRFEEGTADPVAENAELRTAAMSANGGAAVGFDNPEYKLILNNTSAGTGWEANAVLGANAGNIYDANQTIIFQLRNLPIYGRLGANNGIIAPIIGWGRLKSVYNGDVEQGAFWYNYPVPPRIDLNNDAEIVLNELNVAVTDEEGKKIDFLDPHTSLLIEMTPNPPDGVRPHGSR